MHASGLRELPDSELMSRYRNDGDFYSLSELFSRYEHLVLFICNGYFKRREDADDAAREILLRVAKGLRHTNVVQFKSWLSAVTKNYCYAQIKENQWFNSRIEISSEGLDDKHVESEDLTSLVVRNEDLVHLSTALNTLEGMQKRCIEAFYLMEKSYADIMLELNLSYNDVKAHLQSGRRNLKKRLLKAGGHRED